MTIREKFMASGSTKYCMDQTQPCTVAIYRKRL